MDMDFPDLQELEWLEANNSNFQDDVDFDLDFPPEPPSPPSELEPLRDSPEPKIPSFKPTLSLPPKPSPIKTQTNLKKRFRPDLSPDLIDRGDGRPTGDPEEKRSRVDNGDDEEDEDWLRYPPPRPVAGNVDAGVAMSESEKVEERVLSRYATEIDGDYVPITGLDGERVYAKICGVECEDRVKKLDMRGDLNGQFFFFFFLKSVSSYLSKKVCFFLFTCSFICLSVEKSMQKLPRK